MTLADVLLSTAHGLGLKTIEEVEDGTSFGYIASNDEVLIVSFRGTNEILDWATNLSIRATSTPPGYAHSGFKSATRTLLDRAMASAKAQGLGTKKLWITGHSLGGAMALLFAHECINDSAKPSGLVTFGQPMVADGRLAAHLNEQLQGRYLRFVHGGDIVPRIFPTYSHCGNIVWFTDGRYKFDKPAIRAMANKAKGPAAPLAYETGPQPMSEAEFEQLQGEIRERRRLFRLRKGRQKIDEVAAAPAALADHYMLGYIHWIGFFANESTASTARAVDRIP